MNKSFPFLFIPSGFTLIELLIVIAIIGVISTIAIPAFSSLYSRSCLYSVASEIAEMVNEARQRALEEKYYAITFDTVKGRISLVSDRGPDGKWNTADDCVVRSFTLQQRGNGLSFGLGNRGPIKKGMSVQADGVTYGGNTLSCNPDLAGSAGSVYIQSTSGAAVAISTNDSDFRCKIYHWDGKGWVRQ